MALIPINWRTAIATDSLGYVVWYGGVLREKIRDGERPDDMMLGRLQGAVNSRLARLTNGGVEGGEVDDRRVSEFTSFVDNETGEYVIVWRVPFRRAAGAGPGVTLRLVK